MVETLFFFHPAVWWISRRVREERELCCDDIAVKTCSDPALYASALLRLEEERRTPLAPRHGARRPSVARRSPRPHPPHSRRPLRRGPAVLPPRVPRRNRRRADRLPLPAPESLSPASERSPKLPPPSLPSPAAFAHRSSTEPSTPCCRPRRPRPNPAPMSPQPDAERGPAKRIRRTKRRTPSPKTTGHSDYIDEMSAAGYDVDLDKYIAMKVQGITPGLRRGNVQSIRRQTQRRQTHRPEGPGHHRLTTSPKCALPASTATPTNSSPCACRTSRPSTPPRWPKRPANQTLTDRQR